MGKKSSAANKKRQQADNAARQRTQRARTVPRSERVDVDPTYWHGGWPGMEPGTILVGAAEATQLGIDPAQYTGHKINNDLTPYNPKKVYFSSQREFARAFANNTRMADEQTGVVFQRGALYRVEPLGDIDADPDFLDSGVSWCASQARIIAVEDPNVMMDAYTSTQSIGPYMTWTDGSPVYSATGEYLLSPEQAQSGQNQSKLSAILPWTPLEHVNAALTRKRSGDRPRASDHIEVAHEADEAASVLVRHFARATALMASGIEFSSDYLPVLDKVNALIAPAELNEVDPQGVIVALHPQEGVIGVCVVTAAQMGEDQSQMVVMIDRVAVAPAWRHQGVGSVLLLTVQQLLPSSVDFAVGHCPPEVAPFFAQMGFTVLNPSVPIAFPVQKHQKDLQPVQFPDDECGFYRQGRA